jgi:CelD/BcsL family acetyltransferase involved in cellulose biosynthesis
VVASAVLIGGAMDCMIRVALIESARDFRAQRGSWIDLCSRALGASLYNSFDWLDAAQIAFEDHESRPFVVCIEDDERLIAAAPMTLSRRCLKGAIDPLSRTSDFLVDPARPDAIGLLFDAIMRERERWDAIDLAWLPEDSLVLSHLVTGGAPDLYVHAVLASATAFVAIEGSTYAEYLATRLSSEQRGTQRERLERAQGEQGFALEVLGGADKEAIALLESVADLGWRREAGTVAHDPRARAFAGELSRRAADEGEPVLVRLMIHRRPAGLVWGLVDRRVYSILQISWDPEFRAFHPAQIVTERAIEEAFGLRLVRIDFAGVAEAHALTYTSTTRSHASVFIYHSGVRSRIHRAMRRSVVPLARQLIGRGERRPMLTVAGHRRLGSVDR